MAAGVVIKHKRKAGNFAANDLAAGEVGVNTTDKCLNFSTTGSDMVWQQKISTVTTSASPTPTGDAWWNLFTVTALSDATATFGAPSGTPANGNTLIIRVKDNGTGRTLAWNAIYRAIGVTLPLSTTASKTRYIGFIYNSADSKWDCIASVLEA
jgi:hypothetical protein